MKAIAWVCVLFVVAAQSIGCREQETPSKTLKLATTTSTDDSGLLDELLPEFEKQTGIQVRVVAVGSGQAIELGRRGDVDVLLTHAPAMEQQFVAEGWGTDRRSVMHNDFVLIGPTSDPADVKSADSIAAAFQRIADNKSQFVSRSDESATHQKEIEIWAKTDAEPDGPWYLRAGAGMAQVLRISQEKQSYTLTDRGTYLALKGEMELEVLAEGDSMLQNPYSVLTVNRQKHDHVNSEGARKLADFLVSSRGKAMIARFGVDKYGQPLFFPEP